jgi:hypothetical protein
MLTQGGGGGAVGPHASTLRPLAAPQPDDSHPLPIASACDLVEVTHRRPLWLTGRYHPGCRAVDDLGIEVLTRSCPHLARLELYWNTRVTSAAVRHVAARCKQLTHLNLSGCKHVGDEGVAALGASGGPVALRFLDLTRCPRVAVRAALTRSGRSWGGGGGECRTGAMA